MTEKLLLYAQQNKHEALTTTKEEHSPNLGTITINGNI